MTKRAAIINDLVKILSEISVRNMYRTDLGVNVSEYNADILSDDSVPCAYVKDAGTEFLDTYPNAHEQIMTTEILLLCAEKSNTLPYLRNMISDVYEAIGKHELSLRTKYKDIRLTAGGDELDIVREDKTIGGAKITIHITYITKKWLQNEPEYN